MQSAYTLGPLLQCKHFNVRRLERYLWKLVYATIFFLFLPSISWTLKYVSQNFELIKKKFRVRHLQNSSLQAEILKKITLNFKSALPVRKLCQDQLPVLHQCRTWMSNLLSLLYIGSSLRLSLSDFECDCVCAICFWVLRKLCYLQSYLIGSANLKFQLTTSILRENNLKFWENTSKLWLIKSNFQVMDGNFHLFLAETSFHRELMCLQWWRAVSVQLWLRR